MAKIALVTGSRYLNTAKWRIIVGHALHTERVREILHGGAKGVDALAADVADSYGMKAHLFPADWQKHGLAAGPIRNREMLDYLLHRRDMGDTVIGLAFHDDIEKSKGTKDMVRKMLAAGVPVTIYDGTGG